MPNRFWYFAKLGIVLFVTVFAMREFAFFEMSQVLLQGQAIEGRNRALFVLFPAGGQGLAFITLACALILKVAVKNTIYKPQREN